MKYNNIWLILLLSFVILISGCFHEGIDKKTAECIASTSKVYISGQCENCVMQEEVFGESYIYMNVIDCKLNQEDCIEKDIMEVPTWLFGEERISGVLTEEQLKQYTGC